MLHEDAEADVVREDGLPLRAVRGVVRHGGVELGDEEPRLGLVLVAHDVSVGVGVGVGCGRVVPQREKRSAHTQQAVDREG